MRAFQSPVLLCQNSFWFVRYAYVNGESVGRGGELELSIMANFIGLRVFEVI